MVPPASALAVGVLALLSVSASPAVEEAVRVYGGALKEAAHVEKYAIERQRDVTFLLLSRR